MSAVKVFVYRAKNGDWYWRAVASNGNVVATSGEGYKHRLYAREAAEARNPGAEIIHLPEGGR